MSNARDTAAASIDAHASSIDGLHSGLDALPGVDHAKLQSAVDTLKAAHKQFRSDALECMN